MQFDSPMADEFPLIFDSWSRSFKKSPWAGCVTNDMWDQVSRKTMTDIIDRGARILVAHVELPEGKRRVMGYSVSEPSKCVLHWLYVKKDFRDTALGVQVELLRRTVQDWPIDHYWIYTHKTRSSERLLHGWTWDPTLARIK